MLRILFLPVVVLFSFSFVAKQVNVKLLIFASNSWFEVVIAPCGPVLNQMCDPDMHEPA